MEDGGEGIESGMCEFDLKGIKHADRKRRKSAREHPIKRHSADCKSYSPL
jgi:hypothetical protein